MKKSMKILSLVLVLVMAVLSLASCSKYGALKSAFEKAGYEENTKLEDEAAEIQKELEKDNLVVTLHLMTKSGGLTAGITSALIIEFQSTEDMKKAYEDSETIKGLVKDISTNEDVKQFQKLLEDAGYAKGNCLVVPLSILFVNEITNIVKGA